jgi:prophage antirepressor-like protein
MNNNIIPLDYKGQQVRMTGTKENPLWVLKDVCDVLDIKNPTDVSKRLDPDEVTRLNLGGLSGVVNVVTESGLYAVILRSDKPEAKPFRKWITSEVIPSIRKTGSYSVKQDKPKKSALPLASSNHMIEMLTRSWKAAGVDPKNIASMQTGLARDALAPYGLHVPELPIAVDRTYDATEMAKSLGILSKAGLPHAQAVTAIIKMLDIPASETFITQTTAHGHGKAVLDVRYSEKVRDKVLQWLEEHDWPSPIVGETIGKKYYVIYQQVAAA